MNRNDFLRKSTLAASGLALFPHAHAMEHGLSSKPAGKLVGVQIAPHSLYDEGIDYCLDILGRRGNINTLLVNPYYYYGTMGRSLDLMADHGVKKADNSVRELPFSWIKHSEEHFKDVSIKHPQASAKQAYHNRDIFADLVKPARERNIKVFVRLYEGWGNVRSKMIPNWNNVLGIDMYGTLHQLPCVNNPEFQIWWKSSLEDMLLNNKIDGIQFGFERSGSLHHVMMGRTATCFCKYCIEKGNAKNIDSERAREGFIKLYDFLKDVEENNARPALGVFPKVLRIWLNYPEIFLWEKQEQESRISFLSLLYGTTKAINSEIPFGLHCPDAVCRNIFTRATEEYAKMMHCADFFKLIVYQEIEGQRFKRDMGIYQKRIFPGMSAEEITAMMFSFFNYNADAFPGYDELDKKGLGPEYVYNETKRCVDEVDDKVSVYAGIGLDIPKGAIWGNTRFDSNPGEIEQGVEMAVKAGARGLVASREYEEITLESLSAFGNAVKKYFL